MFKLVKLFLWVVALGVFIWFGFAVKLGKHTLFGHVQRIWKADATQDLVDGTKEKAGPAYDKVKKGVKAGYKEATKDAPDAGAKKKRPR